MEQLACSGIWGLFVLGMGWKWACSFLTSRLRGVREVERLLDVRLDGVVFLLRMNWIHVWMDRGMDREMGCVLTSSVG